MGTSRGLAAGAAKSEGAEACRRKFLRYFPGGFADGTYVEWERGYYKSRPSWETYSNYLDFAETVRRDQKPLRPRDLIDIQSFLWVQGSDEYPD